MTKEFLLKTLDFFEKVWYNNLLYLIVCKNKILGRKKLYKSDTYNRQTEKQAEVCRTQQNRKNQVSGWK
jgi:hypothetical protein